MKNMISKIVAIVLSLCAFLGLFLDKFTKGVIDTAIGTTKPSFYNFTEWFDSVKDFVQIKELTWMPFAQYALYASLVLAGLIVVLVALQFFIRNKNLNSIVVAVSVLAIAVGVVSFLTLFLGIKEINDNLTTSIASIKYSLDMGAYLMVFGTLLGGIFGLNCTNKVKRRK